MIFFKILVNLSIVLGLLFICVEMLQKILKKKILGEGNSSVYQMVSDGLRVWKKPVATTTTITKKKKNKKKKITNMILIAWFILKNINTYLLLDNIQVYNQISWEDHKHY